MCEQEIQLIAIICLFDFVCGTQICFHHLIFKRVFWTTLFLKGSFAHLYRCECPFFIRCSLTRSKNDFPLASQTCDDFSNLTGEFLQAFHGPFEMSGERNLGHHQECQAGRWQSLHEKK